MTGSNQEGGIFDIGYIHEIYPQLNPTELDFVLTQKAVTTDLKSGKSRYCELGCGYGDTLVVLAAMDPEGEYLGIDGNVQHIGSARELAQKADIKNVKFLHLTFEEALNEDLGPFDWILAHKVISLVDEFVEGQIIAFIKSFLRERGKVCVSYYSMPGQAQMAPLERMMDFFRSLTPEDKPDGDRCRIAFAQIQDLAERKGGIFAQNARLANQVNRLGKNSINYLVHEHFGAHWKPPYFIDLANRFQDMGLEFAGSAFSLRNVDEYQYKRGLMGYLNRFKKPLIREQVADFLRNTSFRTDVFAHKMRHLSRQERLEKWRETVFGLVRSKKDIKAELRLPEGTASLDGPMFWSAVECLQEDPKTLTNIEKETGYDAEKLIKTFLNPMLVSNQVKPMQTKTADTSKVKRLNDILAKRGRDQKPMNALATAYGLALPIPLLEQIHLTVDNGSGGGTSGKVMAILKENGRSITDNSGRAITDETMEMEKLAELLAEFEENKRPLYQSLGIV